MKKFLFLISLALLGCNSAENKYKQYDKHQQNAMLQYTDRDYEAALENFNQAIELVPGENVSDYFYAAAAALRLGKDEVAKELLIKSIENTKAAEEYFVNFGGFNGFHDKALFSEIRKDYDKHMETFYAQLEHPEVYKEVDRMLKKDQEIRTNGSSPEEMRVVDSLNINKLIEITKQHGWQKKSWLILWHQRGTYGEDNYVWNFFTPYINEQIEKGNIRKDFWTIYEDEQNIRNNQQQIYGHYSGQFDMFPLKDVEKVDSLRISKDLPPLWYLDKVYGTGLPNGYKAPENQASI